MDVAPLPPASPPRRRPPAPERLQLAVVHDTAGPRVRVGMVWFVASVTAAAVARPLLALVLAVAAGAAAGQVARLRVGIRPEHTPGGRALVAHLLAEPHGLPAALGGAAIPLAAAAGVSTLTAALPAVVLVVAVHRLATVGDGRPALPEAALAVTASLGFGLAAAGVVLVAEVAPSAAVVLIVLVSAYDAGDFIVGSGSAAVWEGPAAGIASVGVFAFAASVVVLPPLTPGSIATLGALTAITAPLGPLAVSLLLGTGRRRARYARRLDSLLVLGPLAPWVLLATL
ncbi:MAG TPA: hypothetical protein VMN58_06730 [Acidimicrobiales bacterium]|nr:hypothetical protein [Acidimicrobiales bacterium]